MNSGQFEFDDVSVQEEVFVSPKNCRSSNFGPKQRWHVFLLVTIYYFAKNNWIGKTCRKLAQIDWEKIHELYMKKWGETFRTFLQIKKCFFNLKLSKDERILQISINLNDLILKTLKHISPYNIYEINLDFFLTSIKSDQNTSDLENRLKSIVVNNKALYEFPEFLKECIDNYLIIGENVKNYRKFDVKKNKKEYKKYKIKSETNDIQKYQNFSQAFSSNSNENTFSLKTFDNTFTSGGFERFGFPDSRFQNFGIFNPVSNTIYNNDYFNYKNIYSNYPKSVTPQGLINSQENSSFRIMQNLPFDFSFEDSEFQNSSTQFNQNMPLFNNRTYGNRDIPMKSDQKVYVTAEPLGFNPVPFMNQHFLTNDNPPIEYLTHNSINFNANKFKNNENIPSVNQNVGSANKIEPKIDLQGSYFIDDETKNIYSRKLKNQNDFKTNFKNSHGKRTPSNFSDYMCVKSATHNREKAKSDTKFQNLALDTQFDVNSLKKFTFNNF